MNKGVALAAITGFAIAVVSQSKATTWATACSKPWVYFDLGNTLVNSGPGKPMSYVPGAQEYLRELKARGFRIGMITNVPDNWGPTTRTKIAKLKRTLAQEWTQDPKSRGMNWSDFSDALILVPPRDEFRKPAPYLFRSALSQVTLEEGETKCRVVFQGESPDEVAVARREGMIAHLSSPEQPFLPIPELERLVGLPGN